MKKLNMNNAEHHQIKELYQVVLAGIDNSHMMNEKGYCKQCKNDRDWILLTQQAECSSKISKE